MTEADLPDTRGAPGPGPYRPDPAERGRGSERRRADISREYGRMQGYRELLSVLRPQPGRGTMSRVAAAFEYAATLAID